MSYPQRVDIIEVGPRDGLQNEATLIEVADKVALIDSLAQAGLKTIEAGSFVNPKWVPQMANSDEVFEALERCPGVRYTALTPNLRGLQRALDVGVDEVAVFAAASESFSQRNINCSIAESLERFTPLLSAAEQARIPVRAYVSCVLGCPYEGAIAATRVLEVSRALLELGCYEVSLGDTIGVGSAGSMRRLLDTLQPELGTQRLALHCHNTYGQALANILVGLEYGISRIDSAVGGLGGCPYAAGATGNVATEDVIYLLEDLGIETGVNLDALLAAGSEINARLGRQSASSVARARAPAAV